MKVIWLGQAGLLFDFDGIRVMIDPYLSDNVGKIDPEKHRRVPVDESFFDVQPDIIIFTHDHLDHYDPETVKRFVTDETKITVLSPWSVYSKVRTIGGKNNFVLFDSHTVWNEIGVRFYAVKAKHSDPCAIGVIIENNEKKYYVTGDTLLNEDVFTDIPDDVYAVFLPVNGVGNNMNMLDAKEFCSRINAKYVVPMHCGLFDSIDMNNLDCENKIVPQFYKEVSFG